MLVKGLLSARNILLEEMERISKAINESIDLTDFISQLDDTKLFGSSLVPHLSSRNSDTSVCDSIESRDDIEVHALLHFSQPFYQFHVSS